jgi:hypothetical protein
VVTPAAAGRDTSAQARQADRPYHEDMGTAVRRTGWSLAWRLAVALAAFGGICLVASMLIAFFIADHSSSDSSASSLIAIGLGGLGFLAALLGAVLLGGLALARFWRRARRPPQRAPGSS